MWLSDQSQKSQGHRKWHKWPNKQPLRNKMQLLNLLFRGRKSSSMLLVWRTLIYDQNTTTACQPKRGESSRIQEECILLIQWMCRKRKLPIYKFLKWDILVTVERHNKLAMTWAVLKGITRLTVLGCRRVLRCEEAFAQILGTSCPILIIKT